MITRIDWISFTIPGGEPDPTATNPGWAVALLALSNVSKGLRRLFEHEGTVLDGAGRAPFKASLRNQEIGISVFYGHKKNLVLVEISGLGCETLRRFDGEQKLLSAAHDRLTRLDIACDFESGVSPAEFSSQRATDRFTSGAHMTSETGETVYVGSRTSDRYARVYRYHPPHPRSNFLRCEMVLRDEQARLTAQTLLTEPLDIVAQRVGLAFGWSHPLWGSTSSALEKLSASRPVDRGGGTVRWLFTQVLSAISKLINEGHRDTIIEFVAEIASMLYD